MDTINSAILLTNDDFSYANSLKKVLRENNYELIYTKQFEKLIDFSVASKHSLIFIDNCFSMYKSILKFFLERSECFQNHVVIFIDEDLTKYKEYINNVRVFALNKNKIESSLAPILKSTATIKRLSTNINCAKLNEYLTNYLLKIGFNPKFIGFDYIKKLIIFCANNNGFTLSCLQQSVFPKLAILYNKPVANIERNIRSAIKHASKSKNFTEEFSKYGLGDSKKVTTRTFLSFLLNKCHTVYASDLSFSKASSVKEQV